jgi:hypothetical protein
MSVTNFDELFAAVKADGGVLTVGMWLLRNLQGAGKLGARVIDDIERELKKRGLRHMPASLPTSQNDPVRLFIGSARVGHLIDAALEVSPDADAVLREHAETKTGVLRQRIREIAMKADAMGLSSPHFDMKRFSDDLSGEEA